MFLTDDSKSCRPGRHSTWVPSCLSPFTILAQPIYQSTWDLRWQVYTRMLLALLWRARHSSDHWFQMPLKGIWCITLYIRVLHILSSYSLSVLSLVLPNGSISVPLLPPFSCESLPRDCRGWDIRASLSRMCCSCYCVPCINVALLRGCENQHPAYPLSHSKCGAEASYLWFMANYY